MNIQKFQEAIIAVEVGKIMIIKMANVYAETNDVDDASCILDQVQYELELNKK